jgi:hypothetical protein
MMRLSLYPFESTGNYLGMSNRGNRIDLRSAFGEGW